MKTKRTIDINAILATPAYKGCSSRGADMGRRNLIGGMFPWQWEEPIREADEEYVKEPIEDKKLHLQRVTFIDGGYDRGGAYWGSPANLWCGFTKDEQTMIFVREPSRALASEAVLDKIEDVLGENHGFTFYQ